MGNSMRRVLPQLIVVAAGGLAFGMVYRCFLDDPSEASVANYLLRSGVHGMFVAVVGWGDNRYFNLRASAWLRTWPLLAAVALRAIAIAIAAVIAGLQVVIYNRPLSRPARFRDAQGEMGKSSTSSPEGSPSCGASTRLAGKREPLSLFRCRRRRWLCSGK